VVILRPIDNEFEVLEALLDRVPIHLGFFNEFPIVKAPPHHWLDKLFDLLPHLRLEDKHLELLSSYQLKGERNTGLFI